MRPDWPHRARIAHHRLARPAPPAEKTEASVIAIAIPRPGVNRARGAWRRPVDGRRHVAYCTSRARECKATAGSLKKPCQIAANLTP